MKRRIIRLILYAIAIAFVILAAHHGWLDFQPDNWFPIGGAY